MRNSSFSDEIIYVGPMGCRTGFYFITRESVSRSQALELVKETCDFIMGFSGEIPGSKRKECGNYLDHSLPKAQLYAKGLKDVLSSWTVEQMDYQQ